MKLFLVLGVLALVACNSDERQHAERRPAEQAAKVAAERQRLEVVDTAKSALEALGEQPEAEEVWKVCEAVLIANALSVDPSLAEACSGAYTALARKELRKGNFTEAAIYLDQQKFTALESPEAERVREELLQKEQRRRQQAALFQPQAAEPTVSSADRRQAQDFLAELPPACSSSYSSIAADGAVVIHLRCADARQEMSGTIRIKDGIVTEIQ